MLVNWQVCILFSSAKTPSGGLYCPKHSFPPILVVWNNGDFFSLSLSILRPPPRVWFPPPPRFLRTHGKSLPGCQIRCHLGGRRGRKIAIQKTPPLSRSHGPEEGGRTFVLHNFGNRRKNCPTWDITGICSYYEAATTSYIHVQLYTERESN